MYQSKVGLIINPIAGMGGSVGLKGSDGKNILNQARELGAVAHSPDRAKDFLNELYNLKQDLTIYTLEGIMGGKIAKECGFRTEFIHNSELQDKTKLFETSPSDTILAAKILKEKNVSIIIFIGGDGTARDIYKALGNEYPCLGVPAGVKIHSSVFATSPEAAAKIVSKYFKGDAPLRESEVLDIDEDAFRDNQVISKLYGYLKTPYVPTLSQPS
ncbi:MAG: ATP-NAD kinase family protein, partial [Promethearchaeota archaeon]